MDNENRVIICQATALVKMLGVDMLESNLYTPISMIYVILCCLINKRFLKCVLKEQMKLHTG